MPVTRSAKDMRSAAKSSIPSAVVPARKPKPEASGKPSVRPVSGTPSEGENRTPPHPTAAEPRVAPGGPTIKNGRLMKGRGDTERRRQARREEVESEAARREAIERTDPEAAKRRDIEEMADYLRVLAGEKPKLAPRATVSEARKPAEPSFQGAARTLGGGGGPVAPTVAGRKAGGKSTGASGAQAAREARAAALEARLAKQAEEKAKKAAFVEHITKGL
jgi:hypothetical protein